MFNVHKPGAYWAIRGSYQSAGFLYCTLCSLDMSVSSHVLPQVRMFNSRVHTIHPFTAAVTTIHLMLAPLSFLAIFDRPVRYGARTGRWGHAFVDVSNVKEWITHEDEGKQLVTKFDSLYESFKRNDLST